MHFFALSFILHYTEYFSMHHYAGFLQIGSHIMRPGLWKSTMWVQKLPVCFVLLYHNFIYPRHKNRSSQQLKGLVEKMWNWHGQPRPPALIGLKILIIMTSLQNIVISGAQGFLMLMGSKFLIKMTRLQNIKMAWSS